MKNQITIHYDFTDGSELSYSEAIKCTGDFTTNCLEFFKTSNINCKVVSKNGYELSVKSLLNGTSDVIDKQIRKEHDIRKMLIAGSFDWIKDN